MKQLPSVKEQTVVTKQYRILEYRDGAYKNVKGESDYDTEEQAAEQLKNYWSGEYLIVPVFDVTVIYS